MARKVLDVFFNLSTNRHAGAVSGNFFGHAVQHPGVNLFHYKHIFLYRWLQTPSQCTFLSLNPAPQTLVIQLCSNNVVGQGSTDAAPGVAIRSGVDA